MDETFPHFYEDGYLITNGCTTGWPTVFYGGIYRDTNGVPYQLNKGMKKAKPVAEFVTGMRRGNKVNEKQCWWGCDLRYGYSAN